MNRSALKGAVSRCRVSGAVILMLLGVAGLGLVPLASLAAATTPAAGACGPVTHSTNVVEPQAVDMWDAPVDASGEHELILAVHTDEGGDRFCYTYRWDGVEHTSAPVIHMRRGETFAIRLVNDISGPSPGESVPSTAISPCKPMQMPNAPVQHWTGYLDHVIDDRDLSAKPVDTNLHLHGFEGSASDENIFLSTLSTPLHACEYRITIPDTQPPGAYIFHPHAHGAADDELAGGLVGVWIVDADAPQIPRADEHVLLLTYRIPFGADIPTPNRVSKKAYAQAAARHEAARQSAKPVQYDPFDPPPWPSDVPMNAGGIRLDPTGCMGVLHAEPVMSVDGALAPASLDIPAGRTQVLRIANGTSDSPKLLRLLDAQGNPAPLRVVERDGVPVSGDAQHPLAHYIAMDQLMLSPMSRAAILLTAVPGARFVLASEPFCAGAAGTFEMQHNLLRITATDDATGGPNRLHATPIAIAATPAAKLVAWVTAHPPLVHRRALTFTQYGFPTRGKIPQHSAFYITDTTNPDFHEHPFWPTYRSGATVPTRADIVVKQGTVEVWYLINATLEAHDFHIHQMAFVNERDYSGLPDTADTTFVRVGKVLPNPGDPNYPLIQPSITRVILDFRHVPKGTFVFHCHMLYHEDHGMMGTIRVE